jgi:hypothetical protein
MNNQTLIATLTPLTIAAFLFTLLIYALNGGNPLNRLVYGMFVSVLPVLGALIVLKLTNVFVSWRGAAVVYSAFFFLVLMVSRFG